MIKRTTSVDKISRAVSQYSEKIYGFDCASWVKNRSNIALIDTATKDIALFQKDDTGVYYGHYFFFSRGKEALKTGKQFLEYFFTSYKKAQIIKGLTPLVHLGARWMNKMLGFKSYGLIKTPNDVCELYILTRQEWQKR